MKRNLKLASTAILLLAAPLAFPCDYPQRAAVPDGKTATKQEMIDGQKAVKAYMAGVEDYLACIEAAENDAVEKLQEPTEEVLQQRTDVLNKKHNAAVEEMEIVAAQFNNEVRAYKAQTE